jgi:hypothetical protein
MKTHFTRSRLAIFLRVSLLGLATLASHALLADVVLIVHPSNTVKMDEDTVRHIFLGKNSTFPNNMKAVPLDLKEGASRKVFASKYLRKSEIELEHYWSIKLFTGKGKRPQKLDSEIAIRDMVAKNPDMIGYIDSKNVNDSVKVLDIQPSKLHFFTASGTEK